MSERASARPRASTDTMTMAPSSSSSSLEVDENNEEGVSLPQEPKMLKKMLKKGVAAKTKMNSNKMSQLELWKLQQ
jgi:hypothetical protein